MPPETRLPELPVGALLPNWRPVAPPSPAPLLGRYCRLERLTVDAHAADLHAANQLDRHGRMWTYLAYGPFESLAAYRDWVASTCGGEDPLLFAIIEAASGKAVGVASYLRIDPRNGCIEVGHLAYSPRLQQTPAATEAMYLMMRRAFEAGYRRYEWKCDALNARSRTAAQRLGLSFEGIFRQAVVIKGHNRDTAWYAAIDAEWPALDGAFREWLEPKNFDGAGQQRVSLAQLTSPLLARRG